jgi:hydroxyacylglutathione hydrolase
MQVMTVPTAGLGNRSYIVSDDGVAVVVDPPRDVDRILSQVPDGSRVSHVLETHIHNDYVTGGLELARRVGAAYVVAADEEVSFDRVGLRDGDVLDVGGLRITAIGTPGHTPHHLSYAVTDGQRRAVFTGGSLLYGTVGRTDLLGRDRAEELSRLQHRSARRLVGALEPDTEVFPTHGFGSFCASAGGGEGREDSTIGREAESNIACTAEQEDTFVRTLLEGLDAYPRYYEHMAPINRAGPAVLDLSPPEDVPAGGLEDRQAAGEWLVDVRDRRAFADRHLAGTVNVELADTLATYVGWLLPWGTPVTLLAARVADADRAQRMLARIGIDRPAGRAIDAVGDGVEVRRYPVSDFRGLAQARQRAAAGAAPVVLDVRRDDEWRVGHVAGATHVPLHELLERIDDVPAGEVWVHCASGYRAAIAASLLAGAGRSPVLIDDEYDRAADSGLDVVR